MGHQSSWTGLAAANEATAATPSVLNINEPMIAPRPISDSAMNVLMTLVKNSGVVVAIAMNVAAATSCKMHAQRTHTCQVNTKLHLVLCRRKWLIVRANGTK